MSTENERLQTAQWVLERNLGWIAAAEVKVGVIVAIDTAMLGGVTIPRQSRGHSGCEPLKA
ncbi:hypothetical protein, partial [Acidovorax sp. IB03]|uniref:hypothetical protein n=1 Tax=Acidovorax sp. IB03 TaxID=2779366 RepID=UPI001E3D2917